MPKLKTHKGTKKVLNQRKNDVKIGHPGTRHNTGKKNAASNRSGNLRLHWVKQMQIDLKKYNFN